MADAPITYEQLFDILRREKSRDDLQKMDKNFYDNVRIFLSMKQDTIRAESSAGHHLAVQRASIEYQNVKKIIKELYERRERKIITLALHRTRTEAAIIDNDALLPEEKLFLESLVHIMVQTREQILSTVEMREPIVVTPMPQYAQSYQSQPNYSPQPTSYDQDKQEQQAGPEAPAYAEHPEHAPRKHDAEESAGDTFTSVESSIMVRFLAPVPKFVGKDLRVFGPYEEGTTAQLPDDIAQILIKKGRAQEIDP
jgi:DNA replication initiation complex subunit (GINS family)